MLTKEVIKGFTSTILASRFDNPQPIPEFHETLWDLCCSEEKLVAICAPRGHAKSTSVTLCYVLSLVLFREQNYGVIISDTEGQASQFLTDIKIELQENEDLIKLFGVSAFIKDSATDIVVGMEDGHQFKIVAKGSEQKVRGLKWRNQRPGFIIGDDLENEEIVMNKDRREKFRKWFYGAVIPALSDNGVIRIVGTILHLDSLLERLMNDPEWKTERFRAHNEDFSEILWPEKFSQERLEKIRRSYVNQGFPEGYSCEYLNYPIDDNTAYFKRTDFLFYDPADINTDLLSVYSAADFAITQKQRSDYTVICTVGVDSSNRIYVLDVRKGRWDGKEIIDEMFIVNSRFKPEIFTAEGGMIEKSLGPFLREEMFRRGEFININTMPAVVDKQQRAKSMQGRIRNGAVYFPKDSEWYADFEEELTRFPRGAHDDQVDAFAWIGLTLDSINPGMTDKEFADEEYDDEFGDDYAPMGVCLATGY